MGENKLKSYRLVLWTQGDLVWAHFARISELTHETLQLGETFSVTLAFPCKEIFQIFHRSGLLSTETCYFN